MGLCTHVRDNGGVPGSWLLPGPILAVATTCSVNYQMENLSLSSLSFSSSPLSSPLPCCLSNKITFKISLYDTPSFQLLRHRDAGGQLVYTPTAPQWLNVGPMAMDQTSHDLASTQELQQLQENVGHRNLGSPRTCSDTCRQTPGEGEGTERPRDTLCACWREAPHGR